MINKINKIMETCKCNNCDWTGDEDELTLVEFDSNDEKETPTAIEDLNGNINKLLEEPKERNFLKGCPNCLTDGFLTDL